MKRITIMMLILAALFLNGCNGCSNTAINVDTITEENATKEADKILKELDNM